MKKLLILLFSLFFLSSSSVFADDISDFTIEGISLGDSLLDYMTEDEILKEIERTKYIYTYLKEPNKFAEVYLIKEFPTYKNGLSFLVENNSTSKYISNKNEKYSIVSIRGMINYIEDFDSCLRKKDEIVAELSKIFPDIQKEEGTFEHPADTSGNSVVDFAYFYFDLGGKSEVSCVNFEETFRNKINWSEGLDVAVDTEEISEWLTGF